MKKRILSTVLCLLTLLLLLSSCISYETTVAIEPNGGGRITMCATMEKEVFDFLVEEGFDYESYPGELEKRVFEEDGVRYVELSKSVTSKTEEDLARALSLFTFVGETEESERLFEKVTYEINEEGEILLSGRLAPMGENMDMTLIIEMPTEIVETFGDVRVEEKTATVYVPSGSTESVPFKVTSASVHTIVRRQNTLVAVGVALGIAAAGTVTAICLVSARHKRKCTESEESKAQSEE